MVEGMALRAALRASFSILLRAITTVLRLTLAILATSVGVASGLAWSAASARLRASEGAWRRYFRAELRGFDRARLPGRRDRAAQGTDADASRSGSELRSSGASTAARIAAVVFGCRLRAARLARMSLRSE